MPPDRIDSLVERQHEQDDKIADQGRELSALTQRVNGLKESLDRNTVALEKHAKVLDEYSGARKAIHWIWVACMAFGGWLIGREYKP